MIRNVHDVNAKNNSVENVKVQYSTITKNLNHHSEHCFLLLFITNLCQQFIISSLSFRFNNFVNCFTNMIFASQKSSMLGFGQIPVKADFKILNQQ